MLYSIFAFVKNLFQPETKLVEKKAPKWDPAWTEYIKNTYRNNNLFLNISTNPDIRVIRPDFDILTNEQKLTVLAYFWQCVALFESGYDPVSKSVDVGVSSNLDTWSVGLLQMSVVDQRNHKLDLDYDFQDLQKPIPNLNLGIRIMDRQITKRGKILIPKGQPGLYWATLCPGGRYDKSAKIIKMVQSLKV